MPSKGRKFYAVRKGRVPGVYGSWDACKKQVHGFCDAQFKSFKTAEEARSFVSVTKSLSTESKGLDHSKDNTEPLVTSSDGSVSAETTKTRETSGSTLAIYTDGSCPGNRNVQKNKQRAGWGFVVLEETKSPPATSVLAELWGPVVCDASSPYFMGAAYGSNNTGELSAIGETLCWLHRHETSGRPVTIYFDSLYAANTASGKWNGPKNKALSKIVQGLYRRVCRTREVSLEHVKGHSDHPWNDRADLLANRGVHSCCTIGRYDEDVSDDEKRVRRILSMDPIFSKS